MMRVILGLGMALAVVMPQNTLASARSQAARAVSYDTLMQQDLDGRLASFNRLTPEQKASILRTHIQRWVDTHQAELTPEQLAMTEEWKAFAHVDNFREPVTDERKRVVADVETRSLALFSRAQIRDAITIHGTYVPDPRK